MKNKFIKSLLLFSVILNSCATTDSSNTYSKNEQNPENTTVQKIGSTVLVYSPHGRSHWVSNVEDHNGELKAIQGLLAIGKGLDAERDARKYLEKNPGDPDGFIALASALAISKQFDLASYYGKLLAAKQPNNSISLNLEALSILTKASSINEFKKVEKLLQASFESSSNEIAAGLNLGSLYLDMGNAQSAFNVYNQTANRCSDCFPAYMGLGISARRVDKNSESENAFKRALQLSEEDPNVYYHLALLHKNNLNQSDKAIIYLEKVLDSSKANSNLKEHSQTLLRHIKSQTKADAKDIEAEEKNQNEDSKEKVNPEINDEDRENSEPNITKEELEDISVDDDENAPDDFTLEKDE